jgi:hypothetical protein
VATVRYFGIRACIGALLGGAAAAALDFDQEAEDRHRNETDRRDQPGWRDVNGPRSSGVSIFADSGFAKRVTEE